MKGVVFLLRNQLIKTLRFIFIEVRLILVLNCEKRKGELCLSQLVATTLIVTKSAY